MSTRGRPQRHDSSRVDLPVVGVTANPPHGLAKVVKDGRPARRAGPGQSILHGEYHVAVIRQSRDLPAVFGFRAADPASSVNREHGRPSGMVAGSPSGVVGAINVERQSLSTRASIDEISGRWNENTRRSPQLRTVIEHPSPDRQADK